MMLSILIRASVEGAIVVALICIASRMLRRLSPATQTVLWWCAAVKFLIALLWIAPIALPVLPATNLAIQDVSAPTSQQMIGRKLRLTPETPHVSPIEARPEWTSALVVLWAVGCLGAAAIAFGRSRHTLAMIDRSAWAPMSVQTMAIELASRLGLKNVPAIRVSDDVETPLVAGLRRPTILLPAQRFMALPGRQQQMALCHELAHVRRGDLWLGCAPALAERLFFFHPLVHLATREYAFWREAACDAAVIAALNAPAQEYGRLLLHLGITRQRPALAAAGASWSFLNLKRRIAMLRQSSGRPLFTRVLAVSVVTICVAAMVPVRLTARRAPATRPLSSPESKSPVEFQQSREARLNFVLFVDDHQTTMSGSTGDIERARRYRRGGERLIWFRHEGREFVVRDPRIIDEVVAIWLPVNEIGSEQGRVGGEQGALGAKQGELGAKQGELGAEQGRLGARQGELGARQGVLAAQQAEIGKSEARRRAYETERLDIETQMEALGREMKQLDMKMQELNDPMRELSDQMEVLGKEMEVLGRKMEEASRNAEGEMRALLARVVSSGAAQPVK
jgi:bla regulator protein blaR1